MHRCWVARATVLLLIAGILGGGAGAPVVDALLYHTHPGKARPTVPHFEPLGAHHAHGDQCTLGQLLRVQPSASTSVKPAVVAASLLTAVGVSQTPAARAPRFFSSLHSRAPPARS